MLEFEDSARSEAPPEEVWKILYDPARFSEWWEGMETTSVGDGEFTLQQVGVPELQIPNRLEVRAAGSAVAISCLLHDFVYDWRLEPLDGGRATRITVHVTIPDEKVERFDGRLRATARRARRRGPSGRLTRTHPLFADDLRTVDVGAKQRSRSCKRGCTDRAPGFSHHRKPRSRNLA